MTNSIGLGILQNKTGERERERKGESERAKTLHKINNRTAWALQCTLNRKTRQIFEMNFLRVVKEYNSRHRINNEIL